MKRYLFLLLACLAMVVPSCRHHLLGRGDSFTACGYRFVRQDASSQQLSRGEAAGELVGKIRFRGTAVRIKPVRKGNYSQYTLHLLADGGARGSAELAAGRGKNHFAVVRRNGEVEAAATMPSSLPKDWVCLLNMQGNICLLAWNHKTGGANPKFRARSSKRAAVYKILELDDPRYHHAGFPLHELKIEN